MFSVSFVQLVFGMPTSASARGWMMDVDRIMQAAFSKDGTMDQLKQYISKSGITSSALEHAVPEQLYSTAFSPSNSISAIKALQLANDQGIPVYTITQSNINDVLPQLTVYDTAKNDVINAVNAGKTVIIQKSDVSYAGWNGCGYIILNPDTGAGAYMISSGASGSYTPNYWSGIDTMAVLSSYTGWQLQAVEMPSFITNIYTAVGFIGVAVGFVMDLTHALNDPNLTAAQRAAATCLLIGIAIFAGLAVYLGSIVAMTFTIFAEGVFIMFALNWMREQIMEYIVTSAVSLYKVRTV
jgi:hypothetical protein